jgi:hypothetical protein
MKPAASLPSVWRVWVFGFLPSVHLVREDSAPGKYRRPGNAGHREKTAA